MSARLPLPIEIIGDTSRESGVAAQALVFRHASRLHVVVQTKVSFYLVPDLAMRGGPVPGFRFADELDGQDAPTAADDFRPLRRLTDVTFTGHGYAPGQNPVRRMLVRFAVVRPRAAGGPLEDGVALFDKSLGLIGERVATPREPNPFPTAFVRLPISYRLALGGPHDPQNPLGIGREPSPDGSLRLPSVVPAGEAHVTALPLGFAPLIFRSPHRRNGAPDAASIIDLPDDLDFDSFQVAPFDQRVELLRGDEWIYLENLHPRWPRIASRLPDLLGEARFVSGNGEARRLPLKIDELAVDGDQGRVDVLAVGSFPIDDQRELSALGLQVALSTHGRSIVWPSPSTDRQRRVEGHDDEAQRATIPIAERQASRGSSSTMVIELPDATDVPRETARFQAAPGVPATPFESVAPAIEDAPSTQVFPSTFERQRTAVIAVEAPPSTHAPFRVQRARNPIVEAPEEQAPAIPGAPWEEPAPEAVRRRASPSEGLLGDRFDVTQTVDLPPETRAPDGEVPSPTVAVEPPPLPSSPPPAPPSLAAPSRAHGRKAGAVLWAKPEPVRETAEPPRLPKPAVPAPAIKTGSLYKQFRKP